MQRERWKAIQIAHRFYFPPGIKAQIPVGMQPVGCAPRRVKMEIEDLAKMFCRVYHDFCSIFPSPRTFFDSLNSTVTGSSQRSASTATAMVPADNSPK